MRIVCRQMILMKYHTLIFSKIRKDVAKYVAKDVAMRVNQYAGRFLMVLFN